MWVRIGARATERDFISFGEVLLIPLAELRCCLITCSTSSIEKGVNRAMADLEGTVGTGVKVASSKVWYKLE